jgi:hypothetical protein
VVESSIGKNGEKNMQIQPPEAVKLAKEFLLSIHPGAQNVMAEEIIAYGR